MVDSMKLPQVSLLELFLIAELGIVAVGCVVVAFDRPRRKTWTILVLLSCAVIGIAGAFVARMQSI